MIWIILGGIIILLIIIVRFLNDVKSQNNQVLDSGGMRNKYPILIEGLKGSKGQILRERASSIVVGMHNMDGGTEWNIVQTFGSVTIQWNVKSSMFGNHHLEWTFVESLDQRKMLDDIETSLQQYHKPLL